MAKPKIVTPVLHFSDQDWSKEANYFTDDYQYYQADTDDLHQEFVTKKPLFKANGKLNSAYRNAVFILDQAFPWFNDLEILKQLPANELLVSKTVPLSAESKHLLELKGAFFFDQETTPHQLISDIQHYFYYDPDGYRLDPRAWQINHKKIESVSRRGEIYQAVELKPSDDWELLMTNDNATYLPAKMSNKVSLDYQTGPDNELGIKIRQIDAQTHAVIQTVFLQGEELEQSFSIDSDEKATFFQVLIYGKGKGSVKVGTLHIRRSRGPYGEMMPNDQVLNDQALHSNVGIYFDAGDLKPPLNVYFAGYRTKEGYEARRMMQNFGAPFLLISDWRLEGGAFYLGDEAFEQQIVQTIKDTLKKLHFKENDLILAGMSMGTFGAMYYGAKLNPKGIVVGKPLAEVGTIAQNGRVKRPDDFRTSEDMQLYFEDDLSEASSQKLDQRFWQNFENGTLSETTMAVAYMLQDDYNKDAYKGLRQRFPALNPTGKLLAKGFEGRHNDQTGPIVAWFQRNYWHLLEPYGRKRPYKPKERGKKK
ncbi:accessory Sec system protein Asp2 [Fructilactobacillus frigidiflavus]|uniref:accessory Sec system protein Asp2 n=1 Tax=Fructilactobacillus frigidiflavus TaxID=3242688 RepID=UPI003757A286